MNVYYIKRHRNYPPLRIIDTPGFGESLESDKNILQLIKNGFEIKIDTINAICFVANSSITKLTPKQKFILLEIMNLFGNDVTENFMTILTFCEGREPQIIDELKNESIFYNILPYLQNPWYIKFNNSTIFSSSKDKFSEMFWELF